VDALIVTHPDIGKAARDSYYPLLVPAEQAGARWQLVAPGQPAFIELSVSNPFGGAGSATWMATLLEFRLVRLPQCSPGQDAEMIAHALLQAQIRRIGTDRLRIELRMPETRPACFSGTVVLRDGTRIEALFMTG
jgi:hypothetical protein